MGSRIKAWILHRRQVVGRVKFALESILAVVGVAALGVAAWHQIDSSSHAIETYPGEGKRVVAFRQVVNRICTEHQDNLSRVLRQARNRVQRLAYVARAMGWDVNDLEGVTAPPVRVHGFAAVLAVRRRAGPVVLDLQRAIELHDADQQATAIARLEALIAESRESSRSTGVVRCIRMLPPVAVLIAH